MRCILIFIYFFVTNFISSLPITTSNEFDHYQQIRSLPSIDYNNNLVNLNISSINGDNSSSNICSTQSINIDKPLNETHIQNRTSTTINTISISQFTSSWERKVVPYNDDNDDEDDDHATALNIIEIIFTIPYNISNESVLNKTVFITDGIHNQLLASLTDICINESSFFINYSTIQPLPHNICLYLLLNLTSTMSLREIIFCRTIEDSFNDTYSSDHSGTDANHAVGPSEFFILSQCIIILIMMFTIYGVQTARQKSLVNRARQRLFRSRPYITIFGNKAVVRASRGAVNTSIHSATSLQAGLNRIAFHHRLMTLPNQINAPIEEQVLAANDLTSTINDRRATRASINRDLIDVKEFTKRMSIANQSLPDAELTPM